MPTKRLDIDNEEVLAYLQKVNGSIARTARKFGCCPKVVRNIRDGKRKWYESEETQSKLPVETDEQPLCTNCKIRHKDPELRYLCRKCYRNCGDGDSEPQFTTPSSRRAAST